VLTKSPDSLKRIYDILPPESDKAPYSLLENKLTQRFCKTNEQRLSGLLSSCRRSNLKVQGYLSELRATLGSHYGGSQLQNVLIRHCLMASIDTTTQKLLRLHDNLALDELAKKADKLIQDRQNLQYRQ